MLKSKIPEEIFKIITSEFAYRHKIVPIEFHNNTLKIGYADQCIDQLRNDIEFLTGKCVVGIQLPEEKIYETIKAHYGNEPSNMDAFVSEQEEFQYIEKEFNDNGKLKKELNEISVISLVNRMITNAIDRRASDIHVESYENTSRVRYRIDGVLQEVMDIPRDKKYAIISRLKIMADLDIAEKRRPQDGRFRVKRGNRVIDIRVSTLPTDFGEKIVLRILDKSQINLHLEQLGFDSTTLQRFKSIIHSPYGMILVTRPTGSGKTTTLYAALDYLSTKEVNILTIEDPIEYNLSGINQTQVHSNIGLTFANALRSFLRQDPDIIMVGEIRDSETAKIAVRAALTGHLVFSTLHTNNAADTLTRLLDMGLEPFLLSSSVKMVIAQRLVRTICPQCKMEDKDASDMDSLIEGGRDPLDFVHYKGRGCNQCNGTGYFGRAAIFEVMQISPNIAEAINKRASANQLRKIAMDEGMHTLQENALIKLKEGITTREEVLRETGNV